MTDTGHDLAGLVIIHVTLAAQGIGEDVAFAHSHDIECRSDCVGFPDEATILGVQTPDVPIVCALFRSIEATDVDAAVAGAQGALCGHKIFGCRPYNFPCLGIDTGGQAIILNRQSAPLFLTGRVTEEDRVVKFSIQNTDTAVVAAATIFGEILFPKQLSCIQIPGPDTGPMVLGVIRIGVGINPAHHFPSTVILGGATESKIFF